MDEALQYPVGKFISKETYSPEEIRQNIARIESLPNKMEAVVHSLSPAQLQTPYRPGGWTALQVIHHIPDSHLNAYIRFKWTLTENTPTIKAYDEKAWATTPETSADPMLSVMLLKSLHAKWVVLMRELSPTDLQKCFTHPETGKRIPLDRMIAMYAWHGEHHLGHLQLVKN
jgi:hypothetical protein